MATTVLYSTNKNCFKINQHFASCQNVDLDCKVNVKNEAAICQVLFLHKNGHKPTKQFRIPNSLSSMLKELWKRINPGCSIIVDNIEFIDKSGNRYFYQQLIALMAVE